MSIPTWRERVRYRFDEFMAKGTGALLLGLFALSAVLVGGVAAFVVLTGQAPVEDGQRPGFLGIAWMGLLRTLDTGTMGGDQGSPAFLAAMLVVTLGGVFTVSTLIGILNNGLEDKLTRLRKGRSRVMESGHTVILGWSQQVFTLVSELVLANENQRRSCIVILGERDKLEMEDEIREQVGQTGRTKIVCRNGSPIDLNDLKIAGVSSSRAIVILSPDADDPDSSVIKTILAITNSPDRRPEPYHIVAEIRNPRNMDVARMVGKDEVELILVGDLVSRIVAQTCRQSGLSVIYTELLDFGGDEMYFSEEPQLVGRTFGESLLAYEDSAVMGLKPKDGAVQLNPPMDTVIGAGDQLIVISEDDDTIRLSGLTEHGIRHDLLADRPPLMPGPERTLILGWNWRAPSVITELDQYVVPGSVLTVVAEHADGPSAVAELTGVHNMALTFQAGDTTDRRVLDSLGVETYDHVVLLCYSDTMPAQQADAQTLVTLLHLRDMAAKAGRRFSIVSEMLDIRNRALAEITQADDFIVSERIVSLMLSQVAENKHLNAVFADLFDPEGSEIYLKPAQDYVTTGVPMNFYTVVESARRKSQVAIGYRLAAHAGDASRA
ncbi:MAG: potassium transporter TrkA, partial [Acidobacteria bacterium]|nr:potassium transporter TrkA [Acidobacteriota bacterium]